MIFNEYPNFTKLLKEKKSTTLLFIGNEKKNSKFKINIVINVHCEPLQKHERN